MPILLSPRDIRCCVRERTPIRRYKGSGNLSLGDRWMCLIHKGDYQRTVLYKIWYDIKGDGSTCHQRTSECVFEPGGRIATQVCQREFVSCWFKLFCENHPAWSHMPQNITCKQIRPIARVSLWPVSETERNRDVHVFGFARHLRKNIIWYTHSIYEITSRKHFTWHLQQNIWRIFTTLKSTSNGTPMSHLVYEVCHIMFILFGHF